MKKSFAALTASAALGTAANAADQPNILLITADDMNWDSVGAYGCEVENITPNMDALARKGVMFNHAHVTQTVCMPSRASIMTGLYPHRHGATGFPPIHDSVTPITEVLKEAGYINGLIGKDHLKPKEKYGWDYYKRRSGKQPTMARDPELFRQASLEFMSDALAKDKPFFLMANASDPHRPLAGSDRELNDAKKKNCIFPITRKYMESEVTTPDFLPSTPVVDNEIAQYYTSVHRCDENIGALLGNLKKLDLEDNTIVVFLSDHGMPFPFAKADLYLAGTKTPLIFSFPENIKPANNTNDMISSVDIMPTILEAAGLKAPEGIDGFSYYPLLTGKKQKTRDSVLSEYHYHGAKIDGKRAVIPWPMRSIRNKDFMYVFNFFYDGKTKCPTPRAIRTTFPSLLDAAKNDAEIAERIDFYLIRVQEEFYNIKSDPDCLNNLITKPEHKQTINTMREKLIDQLAANDPAAAEALKNRDTPEAIRAYLESERKKVSKY